MRREEKFPDQNFLNISSLHTDYLNLDNSVSWSSRHYETAHSVHKKCTFVDLITILRKNASKELDRKMGKLAQLVFYLTEIWDVRLGNALDVDLKIT